MTVLSTIVAGTGCGFLVLAGLLAHERSMRSGNKAGAPAGVLRCVLDRAVERAVQNYDRDPLFGPVPPVTLFMVLPAAALLNALLGGSIFLISSYLLIAASVLFHLLLAEVASMAFFRSILSGFGALGAMVVLPYYAVWRLTNHVITAPPAEAALAGMLIALILYAANAGGWTLVHAGTGRMGDTHRHRFIASVLLAVPLGYVVYWFGLLALPMAGVETSTLHGWMPMIGFSLATGVLLAVFRLLLDLRRCPMSIFASAGLGLLAFGVSFALN